MRDTKKGRVRRILFKGKASGGKWKRIGSGPLTGKELRGGESGMIAKKEAEKKLKRSLRSLERRESQDERRKRRKDFFF